MGTLCQLLAFLSFIYCGHCQESSTTPKTSPQTTTLDTFLSSKDDFINIQDNALYYPLTKSLALKSGVKVQYLNQTLEKLLKETETYVQGYRNYEVLNETTMVVGEKEVASFLPLVLPSKNPTDLVASVSNNPHDLSALHRLATAMFDISLADKEFFLKSIVLPALVQADLEFIAGYRWNMSTVTDDLSLKALSKLPVDSVLAITKDVFNSQDLQTKLMDKDSLMVPISSLSSWYALALKHMGDGVFVEKFDAYSKLILAAPVKKMMDDIKNLKAVDRIKVLKENDLDAVKVQAIWDSLDADSLTAENVGQQDIANLFFSVGNKLDIAQIDEFYTKTFAHLYNKRHDVEHLWVHNDQMNLPWPLLKYISSVHWPSISTDKWGQKEMIDLGAFGVGLSRSQLQKIPSAAFATLVNSPGEFFSNRFSLGQMFVIFDKMNEVSKTGFDLPVYLYPCLHSSLLSGDKPAGNMRIGKKAEDMVKASLRFTPAQRIAYLNHLKEDGLWKKQTISLILLNNPSLLGEISTKEFIDNLDVVRDAIWFSKKENFDSVVASVRMLPRRILEAWLKTTVVNDKGEVDVDKLLDITDSTKDDYFTVLQNSASASSIALPGLCCHMVEKIPMDRLMEVLSFYRLAMPEEVIHSDMRMCFVSAIRRYLRSKSVAFGMELSSDIELLSLLSSADIRAIGAELLLSWGGDVLASIPHPEVSYEVLMKISEENPHLYFHNGVSFDAITRLAANMLKISKKKNGGVVDFGVLKRMRDLLPFLESFDDITLSAPQIEQFFRSVYTDSMNKAVCIPDQFRQRFRNFIVKGFGLPSTWTADVLVTLGDLLVVLSENDLYTIKPLALRKALPTLLENSVYSAVYLPEVRGFVEPQLYHKACNQWLTETNIRHTFTPAWERLSLWILSGANLSMAVQPNLQAGTLRRKRDIEATAVQIDADVKLVYNKVTEFVKSTLSSLPKVLQNDVRHLIRLLTEILVEQKEKVQGDDKLVKTAQEKIKILLIKNLTAKLNITANDIDVENKLWTKISEFGVLPESYIPGADIIGGLGRTKRDLSSVDFMALHDKVMQILVAKFETLTLLEQEASKEIIQESQELIGNSTLKILGLDPTKMSLSQADVLSTIETAKAEGMTAEEEAGIVQIAKDAQVRLIQDLSTLLSLTAEDLMISQAAYDEILEQETFVDTEQFMSTAVYEFTTVAGVTESSVDVEETTLNIVDIVSIEENLIHEIAGEIPNPSTLVLTCDVLKTAGIAASMLRKEDLMRMADQEVIDCIETLGSLNYTPEKAEELWPAIKEKMKLTTILSEGQMVLLKNLLPTILKKDLDLIDLKESNIDGVSLLGKVSTDVTYEDLSAAASKYMKDKDGALSGFELQTLGRLLCGLTEHAWHRIPSGPFLAALPQILPINCDKLSEEVSGTLKKKLTMEDGNSVGLSWLAPYVSHNLATMELEKLSGAGARNLGDLSKYSVDQLLMLSPQAASLIPRDMIDELAVGDSNVDKLIALARVSGESIPLRLKYVNILGSKEMDYPVPVMTRKEIQEAEDEAAALLAEQQAKPNSSCSALQTGFTLLISGVVVALYL